MFHRNRLDRGTNALDERALRIKHGNKTSSFNKLLVMDDADHHKDLQVQATKIHKISNNNNNIFALGVNTYNLRNPVSFKMQKVHSAYNCTKTLSHLESKISSLVPLEIGLLSTVWITR